MSLEIYTVLRNFISTAAPTMLIAGVIFIVCVLIWLILRPLNYWYWKVEQRDRMLENMDKKISEIRYIQMRNKDVDVTTKMQGNGLKMQNCQQTSKTANQKNSKEKEIAKQADLIPINDGTLDKSKGKTEIAEIGLQDCQESPKVTEPPRKFSTLEDGIDKTGTVYTREEIEQKIRF